MIKTVIDTNVFISSFYGGKPKQVIDFWKQGNITWCLSPPILDEYFAILKRLQLEDGLLAEHIRLVSTQYNTFFVQNTPNINIVESDPDDNKFIECAVAAESKYIISGDQDLLKIKRYLDIEIINPNDFCSL